MCEMDADEKHVLIPILQVASGIIGVTGAVILSSIAGIDAYRIYAPASLQAQAVNITLPTPAPAYADIPAQLPGQNELVPLPLPQPAPMVYSSQ